jgi:hypothetical protein
MTTQLKAASRLVAAPSNTMGGIRDQLLTALRGARYQIKSVGTSIQVLNGTMANVASLLQRSGWTYDRQRSTLTHTQLDYQLKLSQGKGGTTIQILD